MTIITLGKFAELRSQIAHRIQGVAGHAVVKVLSEFQQMLPTRGCDNELSVGMQTAFELRALDL